jgi:hypothetical protein
LKEVKINLKQHFPNALVKEKYSGSVASMTAETHENALLKFKKMKLKDQLTMLDEF